MNIEQQWTMNSLINFRIFFHPSLVFAEAIINLHQNNLRSQKLMKNLASNFSYWKTFINAMWFFNSSVILILIIFKSKKASDFNTVI